MCDSLAMTWIITRLVSGTNVPSRTASSPAALRWQCHLLFRVVAVLSEHNTSVTMQVQSAIQWRADRSWSPRRPTRPIGRLRKGCSDAAERCVPHPFGSGRCLYLPSWLAPSFVAHFARCALCGLFVYISMAAQTLPSRDEHKRHCTHLHRRRGQRRAARPGAVGYPG